MTEIVIGVLFAAWFVTFYLLIAKLLGPRKEQLAVWRHWTQPTFDAAQIADGKRPQLFLTTEAMSRHHSQPRGQRHAGPQQQPQRPAPDKNR